MAGKDLPPDLWKVIQASLPIYCVDVIPLKPGATPDPMVGLILRETPDGDRWCTIGGRLCLDERVEDAIERELQDAVGDSLTRSTGRENPPPLLVEYMRQAERGRPHDPRNHTVSSTFPIWMEGEGSPRGPEAKQFRWWELGDLDGTVLGFGQESLIPRIRGLGL